MFRPTTFDRKMLRELVDQSYQGDVVSPNVLFADFASWNLSYDLLLFEHHSYTFWKSWTR
ncbi:MAG: hypothetical protein CMJ70_04290 [Planctomycetaceae bacterium]|nr:hypothetical protein [Planctomycetaceae bacterium]